MAQLQEGRGGCILGRKPNLQFFKWWGGWTDTPTAMRYAMAFKDPEVLGLLQLPSPSSESVGNGEEEIANCIAVWGGGLFGADKLETDPGFVGLVHLPPPPGHRQADTVEPPDADGGSGGALSGQSEDTDASSSDGSDSSSTSSFGVEIIEPPTGRPQGGTQLAFRVGKGGGGGVRPRKRRRPGAQGSGGQCETVRTTELCLWVSPVPSKGRGRLARWWECRVSQRDSPPHPNAVCAPPPRAS